MLTDKDLNSYKSVPTTLPLTESVIRSPLGTAPGAANPVVGRDAAFDRPEPYSIRKLSRSSSNAFYQWFRDLPVGRKQLLALLVCELMPLLAVATGAVWLTKSSLQTQLEAQARSEVAIASANYTNSGNQIDLNLHDQASNPRLIEVAKLALRREAVSSDLNEQTKKLLQDEIRGRNVEYATLVGKDLKVIVNANINRKGETFNPANLVSEVLRGDAKQLKATVVVSAADLAKEGVSLLSGAEFALIQYTATPIREAGSSTVIGALVAGETVNEQLPMVEQTLSQFGNGYSGVYFRQPSGKFELATSLVQGNDQNRGLANTHVALPHQPVLEAALSSNQVVTDRVTLNGQPYTIAAKALPNHSVVADGQSLAVAGDQPITVLVRGIPETGMDQLLRQGLWNQAGLVFLGGILMVGWSLVFRRTVVEPLLQLEETATQLAQGDRQGRLAVTSHDEIGQIAHSFNQLADTMRLSEVQMTEQAELQRKQAERAQLFSNATGSIRRSLDFDSILQTSVNELRTLLSVDRVLIYRFNPDFKSGVITAESVTSGFIPAQGRTIEDPLTPDAMDRYVAGRIWICDDIQAANLSPCHCAILERLQTRANMVAPILANGKLVALLAAHQCSGPRSWQDWDVVLFRQLAEQIGFALDQSLLLQKQEASTDLAHRLNQLTSDIRDSFDPKKIINTAVMGTQEIINADRVIVYQFDEQWIGTIMAEAVMRDYPSALGAEVPDPCFAQQYVEKYRRGRVRATPNIYDANLTPCHIQQLEAFAVKANLVAPITINNKLHGLLIAHQCDGPRDWQEPEISFFRQVAIQLGFALEQAALLEARDRDRQLAEQLEQEQRLQRELLQTQLAELLDQIEGVAQGDLTVRADVTAGEIGTVADFFNALVESLRHIVTQVKESTVQVSASVDKNEFAIQQLAQEALQQAEETSHTLNAIEDMTQSIQVVANNAQQAAIVAQDASATMEVGGEAMDLTVQNILNLRTTIGETTKKVKQLGESSQQISKVVGLIHQIALQTNLLAINAGIEAARAGEQGQGFAVVAEEVGQLAAKSAAATQEIEQIVDAIQRDTGDVVEAMDLGTTQVVEGTRLVTDAKQSLMQILAVSRQIDQLVKSISDATELQVQTSQVISQRMQSMAEVSQRTSEASQQVSRSLRQTVEVARDLEESVATFKVD